MRDSLTGPLLVRYGCIALAIVFLLAAVVSFVVLFGRIETTTTVLAGASTAFAVLAVALRRREPQAR